MNETIQKTAIVTGGSRGIGREIVLALLKAGVSVWYLSRSEGLGCKQLSELAQVEPSMVHWVSCDMGNSDSVEQALSSVLEQTKRVDILVNNAGIAIYKKIEDFSEAEFDNIFAINVKGLFFACQQAARKMAKGGRIINIS